MDDDSGIMILTDPTTGQKVGEVTGMPYSVLSELWPNRFPKRKEILASERTLLQVEADILKDQKWLSQQDHHLDYWRMMAIQDYSKDTKRLFSRILDRYYTKREAYFDYTNELQGYDSWVGWFERCFIVDFSESNTQKTMQDEIATRKKENRPFDEQDILYFGYCLLERCRAFTALGIPFLDICPKNIVFVENTNSEFKEQKWNVKFLISTSYQFERLKTHIAAYLARTFKKDVKLAERDVHCCVLVLCDMMKLDFISDYSIQDYSSQDSKTKFWDRHELKSGFFKQQYPKIDKLFNYEHRDGGWYELCFRNACTDWKPQKQVDSSTPMQKHHEKIDILIKEIAEELDKSLKNVRSKVLDHMIF